MLRAVLRLRGEMAALNRKKRQGGKESLSLVHLRVGPLANDNYK